MTKNCDQCIHQEICVFLRGEMLRRKFFGRDFIKELNELKLELADGCQSFLLDPNIKIVN